MALPICVNPRPSAAEESVHTSAFNLAAARACVQASRLAYESPTITTNRCHVTIIEAMASGEVAQTSQSAVSRVSKPAGGPNLPTPATMPRLADMEIGDTAGLETCATSLPPVDLLRVGNPRSAEGPVAIVAFRGTANLVDFITDAKCWRTAVACPALRTPHSDSRTPSVHSGFWLALLEIFEPLSEYLSGLAPRPLIVTGHSLGGALALLFTYRWARSADALNALFPIAATYTFGQPRCGNRAFSNFYDAFHRASTFRCVNEEDVVPRIPGLLAGYRHAGREVFFPFESSSFWIDPPLWRKIISDIRGLYRAWRREPVAALGQLLLDHHISNYIERLGV
jgi:hypothetical protein